MISYMRGLDFIYCNNEKDNKQAKQFFKEAINIDKHLLMLIHMLGFSHILILFIDGASLQ